MTPCILEGQRNLFFFEEKNLKGEEVLSLNAKRYVVEVGEGRGNKTSLNKRVLALISKGFMTFGRSGSLLRKTTKFQICMERKFKVSKPN